MQHLKEQLEQRTQMIEANIKKQQEELRQIHEQLQKVQGQGLQVRDHNYALHCILVADRLHSVRFWTLMDVQASGVSEEGHVACMNADEGGLGDGIRPQFY